MRTYTNRRYLDALAERVLVLSGALGTNIQRYNLTAADFGGEKLWGCNDHLVISKPSVIEEVTAAFYAAGSDIVDTATFRSNRLTLRDYGLQDKVVEINRTAAQLARRIADRFSTPEKPRFVAGDIGPSGMLPSADDPVLSNITFDEIVDVFREQALGLLEGGCDFLILETSQDILELRAAITGLHKAIAETGISVPIQAQVTLDTTGRMLLGTDIAAALTILEGLEIDVVGLNCSTGPEHMRAPVAYLGENAALPVSCVPNAGLPLNVDGEAVYPLEPEPFAESLVEFVHKYNVSMVGGCCGTTPAHIRALVEKLGRHPHPPRPESRAPYLASATRAVPMMQEPPPFLIGERCNAQGSRIFKKMLLAEDYDAILQVARQQVDFGAHGLDISTAVTERPDEADLMRHVVKKLASGVEVPLIIDSTELNVLEAALSTAPGRCLINSTHLESGREKADKVFSLAKKHNAAVMVMTIDEQGMARTAVRKLEVARRIYDMAIYDHGLRPEDLVFDTLTFTLATGDAEYADSAIETIEGIRQIEDALPGVLTSLGVSNLSFGLAAHARPALNSVMLYHAVRAGLDMAIVNPQHVTPYADLPTEERDLAEDLIFNRRPDALQRYIEHFEANAGTKTATSQQADPTEGMSAAERLHWRILHRHKDGVEADIDELIITLTPGPSPEGRGGEQPPSPRGGWDGGEGEDGLFKIKPALPPQLLERCRELRQNATDAENLLWQLLRNRSLHDSKFRRQHPLEGYILDFYCDEAKLAIELDGGQHLEEKQVSYDAKRTEILNNAGIRVLRFWNNDVLKNTEIVLNEIWLALEETLTPNPSPKGRGELPPLPLGEGQGVRAARHATAIHILNNILLPAMKEVGDKFGAGELILPFVLQSAEVMKKSVAHLEQYLERQEGVTKGTVVLATVYGDVHDIGKNLVKTILVNNGYTVVDLGKQVPAETIITKAVEVNATAIGLSALLVSTSKQMPLIVNELQRRGLKFPVLIGGAAINRRFGWRILYTEAETPYEPGVFYCKDAFEGLNVMDTLINPEARPSLLAQLHTDAARELGRADKQPANLSTSQRSTIAPRPISSPQSLGPKVVRSMPLEAVFEHLNINELYRLSWGAKNTHGDEWDKLKAEFDARLAEMKREALRTGWLKPQGVYGLWSCQADGNDLVLYDPASKGAQSLAPLQRFAFPRQPFGDHLCLADYFASVDSGQMDVVALQVVTVGQEATERFEKLQADGNYSEAYFLHGLAVQTAEATAEYLHHHIRRELGLPHGQGKRYSWGYPAIPELEDHRKVFDLLPAEKELGMSLSPAYQLIPEQSTAAIIIHHPEAKYYSVGESRVEQLMR
jgi:methylmalonyl-CoA mutase cobalamin-binding domain/chain